MPLEHNGNSDKHFDISWTTILKLALAFFFFYLVWIVRDILTWVIFGLILSVLFDPLIDFIQKFRISRPIAVFAVYLLAFGMLGYIIYSLAPLFIFEIQQFSAVFPDYFNRFAPFLKGLGFEIFENMETFTGALREWMVRASLSIMSSLASVFGSVFLTLTIFTIAIFFSLEERGIEKMICLMLPKKYEQTVLRLWKSCQIKISGWFGVRIVSSLCVGALTTLACLAFNIKYPIIFGFFAGVLDIIPFIGPIIAGTAISVFALLDSWQKAGLIALVFVIIQQIEGNILTPLLVKKFLKLPAILVLISLLIGERLWGMLGAVLAIPLFGIFYEFTKDFLETNKD